MGTVAQFTPAPPEPLAQSGSSYISNNGEIEVQFTQDASGNNVMQFTDLNRNTFVSWLPQDVKYIDSTGLTDFVYATNNDASLFVSRNFSARYDGHFPDVEEYWTVQAGQVKHYATLTGDMRAPLPFLTDPQLAIGGILEFDPSFSIQSMGMTMSGDFTTPDSINIVDENGQVVFTLPAIEVWDQAGNKTGGSFSVSFNGAGSVYVSMCVDYAWLAQDSIVYPVVIDPTVIVSSGYSIGSPNGRMIVELSNSWIITVAYNTSTDYVYFYVSKDGGNTWSQLCYLINNANAQMAMASSGTNVYFLIAQGSGVLFYTFNATTVGNIDLSYTAQVDSSQSNFNSGCSLAVDGNGRLIAAWCSENSTYPNNWNIRYGISTNGGSSWSVSQLTGYTSQSPIEEAQYPSVFVNSSNQFFILWYTNFNPSMLYIYGPSIGTVEMANNSTHMYNYPIGIIDTNGYIHVFFNYSQLGIYHCVSTNGGTSWSTPEAIFSTSNTSNNFSVGYDPVANKFYVFVVYSGLKLFTGNTGSWSSATTLDSTSGITNVQALWSEFNENSSAAIRYTYTTGSAVEYGAITLAVAPNAPILSSVSNFDATTAQTFSWTYSNQNASDTQSAYELQIVDASTGSVVLDTGKVASTANTYTLAANTLTNGKQYQWRVTTWEETSGQEGPYSQYSTFNTAAAPTAVPTYPTANLVDATSSITVQWSYSDPANNPQASYDLQLLDANNDVLWDSGIVNDSTGTIRSMTVGYTLANNTSYQVKLITTNSQGISSSPVTVAFSTSFTPPPQPTTSATPDNANALITVKIINPAPSGTQPAVASNDIFRRNSGATAWTRVATGIAANATWKDYHVASGQAYDYKITSYGSNGTQIDSVAVTTSGVDLTYGGVWIHDVSDPAGTIMNLPYYNNSMGSTDGTTPNSETYTPNSGTIQVAGRALPIVEFGENYVYTLGKGSVVCFTEDGTWPVLENMIRNLQTTICMRDGRGKMIFGNFPNGYATKELVFGTQVDLNLQQTAYSFAV